MTRPPRAGDLIQYINDGTVRPCYADAIAEVLEVVSARDGRLEMRVKLLESPNRRTDQAMYEDGAEFTEYERLNPVDNEQVSREPRFEIITGFAPSTPVTSPAEAAAFLEQILVKMGKA